MTAVEWLKNQVEKEDGVLTKGFILILLEQAKEMEKEQIIEHGVRCYSNCCGEPDRIAERESEAIYNSRYKI